METEHTPKIKKLMHGVFKTCIYMQMKQFGKIYYSFFPQYYDISIKLDIRETPSHNHMHCIQQA